MSAFLLLCDPALLLPPPSSGDTDTDQGLDFWQRLIAWSADRRVRIGPNTLDLVHASFADLGWPDYKPPGCPTALAQTARRSLNKLLAQGQIPSDGQDSVASAPTLTPKHMLGELIEEAIGYDASRLYSEDLLGIATDRHHWAPPSDSVAFEPPPPTALALISEPTLRLERELDRAVAVFLRHRRITIVGGWQNQDLVNKLCMRFELEPSQIRWTSSEQGERLNLDSLTTLNATRDVVVCVTGHIGHSGRDTVRKRCRKWGIEPRFVDDQNQVAQDLQRSYGSS